MVVSWFWNYEAIKGCTTRASLFFLYVPQKTGSRSGRKAKMFAEKGVLVNNWTSRSPGTTSTLESLGSRVHGLPPTAVSYVGIV